MQRLDTDRQNKLEPARLNMAIKKLEELGFSVTQVGKTELKFEYIGSVVSFFPYSGWHAGKSIKDGRGLRNLLRQLEVKPKEFQEYKNIFEQIEAKVGAKITHCHLGRNNKFQNY